jgi:hypothetical protein
MWLKIVWTIGVALTVTTPGGKAQEAYPKILPFTNPYGALPIQHGSIVFTSSNWWIVYEFNITHIPKTVSALREILDAQPKTSRTETATMNMVLEMVNKVEHEYENLLDMVGRGIVRHNTRLKRGTNLNLPAAGNGIFLHSILGVATEDEIEQTDAYLSTLFQRQQKIVTVQQLQITALKLTSDKVDKQQHQLELLLNVTATLYKLIKTTSKPGETNSLQLIRHGQCMATANALYIAVTELKGMVRGLQEGYLSSEILPPGQLYTVLQQLTLDIPTDLHLIYSADPKRLDPYYSLPLTRHIPSKDIIRGALRIPLKQSILPTLLISIIPFPTTTLNGKERIILASENTYLAYTERDNSVKELGECFDMENCLKGEPIVCPLQAYNPSLRQTTCHQEIMRGDIIGIKRECKIRKVQSQSTIATHTGKETWAVSTPKAVEAKVRCLDSAHRLQEKPDMRLDGTYLIQIPRNCTMRVDDVLIPFQLSEQLHLTTKEMFPLPNPPAEELFHLHNGFQEQTNDEREVEKLLQVLQDLQRDHNGTLGGKLKPLFRAALDNIDAIQHLQPVITMNYASMALWVAGIVGFICTTGWIYHCLKRKITVPVPQYHAVYHQAHVPPPED